MRRPDKARGKAIKTQRRKTLKRRNAPKAASRRTSLADGKGINVARLTRERDAALEQLAATSEVLKVISSSPGELKPVFDAILANATRICGAKFANLFLYSKNNDEFRLAAQQNAPPAYAERWAQKPVLTIGESPRNPLARLAKTKRVVAIPDLMTEPGYIKREPRFVTLVEAAGARTHLLIPMLKEGELIGGIAVYRQEVLPFTDKEIELLMNFAAQAVIAIENTRLLNELRLRTDDLSESLEQQTASSEILASISGSLTDTKPVFDAIVRNLLRLFGSRWACVQVLHDGIIHMPAIDGEKGSEKLIDYYPRPLDENTIGGRAMLSKQVLQFSEIENNPAVPPATQEFAREFGFRSAIFAPMMRETKVIGAIAVANFKPKVFSDKQVALIKAFADQAVIAIENTRLLNELRQRTDDLSESLEQQTATSDVLRVISSSPTNVQPVFDAIAESSVRLCDGQFSFVNRFDGKLVHFASCCGLSAQGLDAFRSILPAPASEDTAAGRAIVRRAVVEISDVGADPSYGARGRGLAKAVDYRSIAAVPLLHEGKPIGAIAVARANAGPFPKRQIALLQAFADQAVIAIENVRLFDEVQARTLELAKSLEDLRTTQDRLVQTQKLALLGQLTAGIAHEIKNPLNFVNNFSGISAELVDELQDTLNGMPLDDKARTQINELTNTLKGNFDKVVHHGKRADAIVKNMLQHSREGSGEHRVIDINALVEESLNLAWHGARAETQGFEIKLKQSFDPSAGRADVFPQDIRRALLNMISNGFYAAIKRRTEINGGDYEPTLTASTKSLGDRVEIRIRDNGTGMTPDVKEQMFNPFFTTKPTGEGTGLGLSISHDIIVKQHGGSIEVDTQPGEFTEIRVILPRVAALLP